MSRQELIYYKRGAWNAALGMSASKSIKSMMSFCGIRRLSPEWEAARKGFEDMRTHMQMKAILEEIARDTAQEDRPDA